MPEEFKPSGWAGPVRAVNKGNKYMSYGWSIQENIGIGVYNPRAVTRGVPILYKLPQEWINTVFELLKKKEVIFLDFIKVNMKQEITSCATASEIALYQEISAVYIAIKTEAIPFDIEPFCFNKKYATQICEYYLKTREKCEWPLLMGVSLIMDQVLGKEFKKEL